MGLLCSCCLTVKPSSRLWKAKLDPPQPMTDVAYAERTLVAFHRPSLPCRALRRRTDSCHLRSGASTVLRQPPFREPAGWKGPNRGPVGRVTLTCAGRK